MQSAQMSAEDQAALDQMREDDAAEAVETPAPAGTGEPGGQQEGEAEQASDERPSRRRTVPLPLLVEEREARKRLEGQLAEERRARQLLDERTNLVLQRFARAEEAQAPKDEIPELSADPVGHLTGRQAQIERQLQQQYEQSTLQQQALTQHLQSLAIQQAVVQRAQGLEQEFQTEHADYGDAVNFLKARRAEELAAIGIDPSQRTAQINQEGFALAVHALQQNRNPAELMYALAQSRGYQPGEEQQAAPAASGRPLPAAERLNSIASGQRQSRSLGNARGSGPAPLTAQRLLEMSNADFEKMIKTPEGRDLLGS